MGLRTLFYRLFFKLDSASSNENEYNVKISGLKNRINIIRTNLFYKSKFDKVLNLIKRIKNTIYYVYYVLSSNQI